MVKHQNVIVATRRATQLLLRSTLSIVLGAALAGCPQGAQSGPTAAAAPAVHPGSANATSPNTQPGTAPVDPPHTDPGPTPTNNAPPVTADPQATVTAVNLSGGSLHQVPVTFGEPFRAGDIPKGNTVVAYLDGTALQTQTDVKARNPDGSVRHAILTVLLPSLAGGASAPLRLRPVPDSGREGPALTLDDVLQTGFDATVELDISGQPWHLDARDLLQHASLSRSCEPYGRECRQWLSGPLASEWVVGGPILDARGRPNPHVAVYFAVRAFGPAPVSRVRVDVIVENDWAYAPDPHNVTYNAKVTVNGQKAYSIDDLEHYRQARWHKVFWWGKFDPVYARQDSRYLQATRGVPRYEDIEISQKVLDKVAKRMQQPQCGPMRNCDQTNNMANAGAQDAIGPLPRWTSAYVIDPTYEAYEWMLGNSDALGSYGIHYRDQLSAAPISVDAHPCATLVGPAEVSRCPVTPYADDRFPGCHGECDSPWNANISHHPAPAYVAYLVTGDWYYLEELTFWADWVEFWQNPKYRDYRTGLIDHNTLRAQGWSLRTLGFAAYILPDSDPFKGYFNRVVKNDIEWYNRRYTDNPSANALHIITNGSLSYPNDGQSHTGIATWQASFFTWSVGNLNDLGFAGAGKLLDWVGAFQINLMTSPDYCWIMASGYELQVRDTQKSPFYTSLKEVYANTYPYLQGVQCSSDEMASLISKHRRGNYHHRRGSMEGYPYSPTGFPANFQIGLAAAVDSNVPNGAKAWSLFTNQSVLPDYSGAPQFAVIPRTVESASR